MKPYALRKHSVDEDFDVWNSWSNGGEPADYCSREGAEALKDKIEAYWRERGLDVMIALQNVGFHPAIRAVRFDVRSDMVNGMPRRSARSAAPVDDFNEGDLAYE